MRVLVWQDFRRFPEVGGNSVYNLSLELAKYLTKYYNDWYVYIMLPDMARISLRGDEKELVDKGRLFLVDTKIPPHGDVVGWPNFGACKKIIKKHRLVFDIFQTNTLLHYSYVLRGLYEAGYGGVKPVSRIDYFNLASGDERYRRFSMDLLKLISRYYPMVVHSKWCLVQGVGVGLDSEEAREITKWGIWYPLIDGGRIKRRSGSTDNDVPKIFFNHKTRKYTGFEKLVKACKILKERGVKVKIYVSFSHKDLAVSTLFKEYGGINGFLGSYRDMVIPVKMKKDVYYERLRDFDAEIAFHEPVGASWSIAVLEAVASGCYPISHGRYFYEEMFNGVLPRFDDSVRGLVDAVQFYVDNREYCDKVADNLSSYVMDTWTWDKRIHDVVRILKYGVSDEELGIGSSVAKILRGVDCVDFDTFMVEYFKRRPTRLDVGQKYGLIPALLNRIRNEGFTDVGGYVPTFCRGDGDK